MCLANAVEHASIDSANGFVSKRSVMHRLDLDLSLLCQPSAADNAAAAELLSGLDDQLDQIDATLPGILAQRGELAARL